MLVRADLPLATSAHHFMSMPATQNRRWTAAEVRRLIAEHPDPTPRFELVNGELLVSPSPSRWHQRIVLELAILLRAYVEKHSLGEVLISPSDTHLDDETILQPDIYVDPAVEGKRPPLTALVTRLLLAVEVLSPGSARYDRVEKRYEYQRTQVPEYWIVDPDARTIERWRPTDERPEILDRQLVWRPVGGTEPFMLDIIAFFAGVSDQPEAGQA